MGPPLPAVPLGASLKPSSSRTKIQVEAYLELLCPYSKRMFDTLDQEVLPIYKDDPDIDFIVYFIIQPWHPQTTAIHEVSLAVKRVAPESYMDMCRIIYKAYGEKEFSDENTIDKSRAQIHEQVISMIPEGVDKDAVKELLQLGPYGNGVTQDIKFLCKLHRTRGVHVTPTVYVNGLEAGAVSSGWTKEQWIEFLKEKGADNFTKTG